MLVRETIERKIASREIKIVRRLNRIRRKRFGARRLRPKLARVRIVVKIDLRKD